MWEVYYDQREFIRLEGISNGNITAQELHAIETEEIKNIVDKQIEVGLQAVTDGEFRRRFWHTDFLNI